MNKAKKLIRNPRVIVLIVFLILAVVAIHPRLDTEGVAIRSVIKNSSAQLAGVQNPKSGIPPTRREVIKAVATKPITDMESYYSAVENLTPDQSLVIETDKELYRLKVKPKYNVTTLPELENVTVEKKVEVNETINGTIVRVNKTINQTIQRNKTVRELVGVQDIGLRVSEVPASNIRKGLDLQGGTRVLLKPEKEITDADAEMVLSNMKQRLNVYGLTDVLVTKAKDLSGDIYFLVEVAGATEEEVKELIGKQGKFEAKISDRVAFRGGEDITYVCRTPKCSGIDPKEGCGQVGNGTWACRFRFTVSLSPQAAERQANITKDLEVVRYSETGELLPEKQQYLNETIDFYLDNVKVDSLNIGKGLKGKPSTDIQISGSGTGPDKQEAARDALKNMKRLQTILITGSLPVKLNIVKTDLISPAMGKAFLDNVLFIGVLAILTVAIIVGIRYQKLQIALPMVFTMISEVVLLMGLAALIGWNIDLAAIAGVIIAVGTGVDHAIVISDEILRGGSAADISWKEKIKRAFFIIMAAYFTTVVAMLPLWFAGAGLLKGFAITTIFGVSFGVFITRPAFASVAEILLKE